MLDLDKLSAEFGVSDNGSQLPLLSTFDIARMAPTKDLIDGVISEKSLAILFGKYASGKSFIALDWAMCVSKGLPWQDRVVSQGAVIYVLAEGISGMRDRVLAWHNGSEPWDGEAAPYFYPEPLSLLSQRSVGRLMGTAKTMGAKLVVFDTLNQSLVGGDENSSVHMGQAIASAKAIQRGAETAVLLVHHTGHNGELRGHSSLPAAADHIIRAWSPEDNPSLVVLYSQKVKEGPRFDPIRLRLERVPVPGSRDGSCRVVQG
jgi:AAA domain